MLSRTRSCVASLTAFGGTEHWTVRNRRGNSDCYNQKWITIKQSVASNPIKQYTQQSQVMTNCFKFSRQFFKTMGPDRFAVAEITKFNCHSRSTKLDHAVRQSRHNFLLMFDLTSVLILPLSNFTQNIASFYTNLYVMPLVKLHHHN